MKKEKEAICCQCGEPLVERSIHDYDSGEDLALLICTHCNLSLEIKKDKKESHII